MFFDNLPLSRFISPHGFLSFPFFFLALNACGLAFLIRFFFRQRNAGFSGNPSDAFCVKHAISKREKEVLALLGKGMGNHAIADSLFISTKTVKYHLYNIFRKTNVNGRYALLHLMASSDKQYESPGIRETNPYLRPVA
jgi:DNA-binding CsgD family transcriptional regulator